MSWLNYYHVISISYFHFSVWDCLTPTWMGTGRPSLTTTLHLCCVKWPNVWSKNFLPNLPSRAIELNFHFYFVYVLFCEDSIPANIKSWATISPSAKCHLNANGVLLMGQKWPIFIYLLGWASPWNNGVYRMYVVHAQLSGGTRCLLWSETASILKLSVCKQQRLCQVCKVV